MSRTLLAKGSRGALVATVQRSLLAKRFYNDVTDGVFGRGTENAASQFQSSIGVQASGKIDEATWTALVEQPVPTVWERCLQLTAAFEGHNYVVLAGNFDGAGLTWGIIGFTLKAGELAGIVREAHDRDPQLVRGPFGDHADKLLDMMRAPADVQMAWADEISVRPRKVRVAEPWASCFAQFGNQADVQAIQVRRAYEKYFVPAKVTAQRVGLHSELGVSLCFDIHVQNGGIKAKAKKAIDAGRPGLPSGDEHALRALIANAVADSARRQYQADVRARKLCIATGDGVVHGAKFALDNWGLGEFAA